MYNFEDANLSLKDRLMYEERRRLLVLALQDRGVSCSQSESMADLIAKVKTITTADEVILDGTAAAGDVLTGKTFYADNWATIIEGTFNTLDIGLIGYYPFNGDALDHSGYGTDGTVQGASFIADAPIENNYSALFDGSNDNIIINNLAPIFGSAQSPWSICFWMKSNETWSSENYPCIMEMLPSESSNWNLRAINIYQWSETGNGRLECDRQSPDGGMGCNAKSVRFNDNQWHHACFTYDGKIIKSYSDGIFNENSPAVNISCQPCKALSIGSSAYTIKSDEYKGQLANLRIYTRAISSNEITLIFTSGV